jgi:indole-3-glycerol phosphate synthase
MTATGSILDKILESKVVEVSERKKYISLTEIEAYATQISRDEPTRDFISALHRETVALIAEVKRASPPKGIMVEDFDHVMIGEIYGANGAAALSVLTDRTYFHGDLKYLYDVRNAVNQPVLCKDFMIDPYQIYAARAAGADAVLLIVAALTDVQMAELHHVAESLGMASLIEVHDEAELVRALKIGGILIGVNNRDLKTFTTDLTTTQRIAKQLPDGITLVAESGIHSVSDVRQMGKWGAHAVLVGEALVTAQDMAMTTRLFASQPRESER